MSSSLINPVPITPSPTPVTPLPRPTPVRPAPQYRVKPHAAEDPPAGDPTLEPLRHSATAWQGFSHALAYGLQGHLYNAYEASRRLRRVVP